MSKFGQYQLFDRIAIGGMAEVFRGRAAGEEGFEKQVAIKRILPTYARDGRFISMLVTEARIHSALTHRNIVQIHDLGVAEDGEYFIVLEYVDGHDLGALLSRLADRRARGSMPAQLSDAVALYIAIELGEGVHFAHEQKGPDGQPLGLIHRDISPSNVLVSYAGEVKLSDFGLAKRRTDHSVVGSLKGKLAYMSPEQARRAPIDRRSDLFALGAVLYEMLTGHPLREIEDDVAGWQQVASGLVPPARRLRPDLSPALERLLSRALEPDPRDRFTDVRAFVNEARAALEEQPRSRLGEAGELQALMRALLPPGTARPTRPPSRVIRLQSEIVSAEAVGALGSDLTVPGTDLAPGAEPSVVTAVGDPDAAATAAAATAAAPVGTPPPGVVPPAPAAMLEWPRPAGAAPLAPPARAVGTGTPASGPRPVAMADGPSTPTVAGPVRPRKPAAVAGLTPPSAARGLGLPSPASARGSARGPNDPDLVEPQRSVAGFIEANDPNQRGPGPGAEGERIIAAWPSLLGGVRPEDVGAAPLGDLPAAVGPRLRLTDETPPLGGADQPITPSPPPPFPPFPPAPSAPGPVPAMPAPAAASPPAPMFAPPVHHNPAEGPHATADYAQPRGQPIYYAPPPPPRHGDARANVRATAPSPPPQPARRAPFLFVLMLGGLAVGAALVHVLVVPLDVLAVWTHPVALHVKTQPSGAEVYLDGRRLTARTPTYTEVSRDRRTHTIEVRREGYLTESQQMRFDRRLKLEMAFVLQPAPVAAPPPPAVTPPPAPAPTAVPAAKADETPRKKPGGKQKSKRKRPRRGTRTR